MRFFLNFLLVFFMLAPQLWCGVVQCGDVWQGGISAPCAHEAGPAENCHIRHSVAVALPVTQCQAAAGMTDVPKSPVAPLLFGIRMFRQCGAGDNPEVMASHLQLLRTVIFII